jgi:hypothetical protein
MFKPIAASTVLALLSLAACQNDGATADSRKPIAEAPEPPAAAPPNPNLTGATINVDPITRAANRDRVEQYPDEVRMNPPKEAQLISGFSAQVRKAPAGEAFSFVETKANVTEVARDKSGNHYLILYSDPKVQGKQLAGWVNKDALENTEWSSTAANNKAIDKMECRSGQKHVRTDADFCARTCMDDTGCDGKTGAVCDGLAFEVAKDGKLSNTRYCTSDSDVSAKTSDAIEPVKSGSPR